MQNKTTLLITVAILSSLLALCVFFYDAIGFESASDLWFEDLTPILLVYIYLTAYHFLIPYAFLTAGGALLLFNKGYDLLTELPKIGYYIILTILKLSILYWSIALYLLIFY